MKRALLFVGLLLLGVGIIGFQAGAYYTFEKLFSRTSTAVHPTSGNGGSSSNKSNSNSGSHGGNSNSTTNSNFIEVNTIINYGNGTTVWFNQTKVATGWNFYNLTLLLANGRIHASYYSDYGENQILGINGVEQDATYYWSLWKFCWSDNAWDWSNVGVDRIVLSNNGIYGWYYQSQSGTQYPPVPGARTVQVLDINSC